MVVGSDDRDARERDRTKEPDRDDIDETDEQHTA
jgi:hypothetical protein